MKNAKHCCTVYVKMSLITNRYERFQFLLYLSHLIPISLKGSYSEHPHLKIIPSADNACLFHKLSHSQTFFTFGKVLEHYQLVTHARPVYQLVIVYKDDLQITRSNDFLSFFFFFCHNAFHLSNENNTWYKITLARDSFIFGRLLNFCLFPVTQDCGPDSYFAFDIVIYLFSKYNISVALLRAQKWKRTN